jgi:hypothetical protein
VGLRKFIAIITAGVILLIITAAWLLPLDEDFRVENPLWNGSQKLSTGYAAQPLESFADLPSSPRGTTLIVVPYLEFTSDELGQIESFVSGGGRLILADDYGHGNRILEYLELEVRFSGDRLLDPLSNYKNSLLPRIIHLKADPLTINTESLVLNHATCLLNTVDAGIIALSSSFSFLDENDNGKYEDDEAIGPLPVIYREIIGNGQIILISDPSLFINGMKPIDRNDAFYQNITDSTTHLYLDQSHLPPSDLHQTKTLLEQGRTYLTHPLATAGLVALAVVTTLKPIWYRKKNGPEKT